MLSIKLKIEKNCGVDGLRWLTSNRIFENPNDMYTMHISIDRSVKFHPAMSLYSLDIQWTSSCVCIFLTSNSILLNKCDKTLWYWNDSYFTPLLRINKLTELIDANQIYGEKTNYQTDFDFQSVRKMKKN